MTRELRHDSDNCPYCADEMCARLDGLGCTHDRIERHGYFVGEARADVDGLVALHDVVMTIESMTWGRVFPAEPTPSTRDLVVFTAALGAAKRRVALLAGDKAALPDGEVITDANGDELEHGAGDKAEAPR